MVTLITTILVTLAPIIVKLMAYLGFTQDQQTAFITWVSAAQLQNKTDATAPSTDDDDAKAALKAEIKP